MPTPEGAPWALVHRDVPAARRANRLSNAWFRDSTAIRHTIQRKQRVENHVPMSIEPDPDNVPLITQEEKERRAKRRRTQRDHDDRVEKEIRLKEEEDIEFCRTRFIIGCFGLPLVLLLNIIMFWGELKNGNNAANFRLRKYVMLSLIVMLVQTTVWIVWFTVYQINRNNDRLASLSILTTDIPIGSLAR